METKKKISLVRWVIGLAILVPLISIWAMFLGGSLRSYRVISGSMIPTLLVGDCVLMKQQADYQDLRGKIIVFPAPDRPEQTLTKRVVAGEHDVVELRQGEFYVNGNPEDLPHDLLVERRFGKWELGENEVFVLGDNRNDSFDSIEFGPLNRNTIQGVLTYRYWPLSRAGSLDEEPR